MKTGDLVKTEYGTGIIVGVDLPESDLWRWVIKIINPIKSHFLIDRNEPMAFFDKEVKPC